jgi:hypothetical protein
VYVVVVEDHRRRDRRQQPADHRVAPRLVVEPDVLLEVRDLLPRSLRRVAPALDEALHVRRDLVGVHLVADHQQQVGPLLGRLVAHAQRVGAQRVDLAAERALVLGQVVRGLVRVADAARSEDQAVPLPLLGGADRRRRHRRAGVRPDPLAVELDGVLVAVARLEPLHVRDRVVATADAERRRAGAEDRHLARLVELDPEGRLGLADVAQEGSEDELGHGLQRTRCNAGRCRRSGARGRRARTRSRSRPA